MSKKEQELEIRVKKLERRIVSLEKALGGEYFSFGDEHHFWTYLNGVVQDLQGKDRSTQLQIDMLAAVLGYESTHQPEATVFKPIEEKK